MTRVFQFCAWCGQYLPVVLQHLGHNHTGLGL